METGGRKLRILVLLLFATAALWFGLNHRRQPPPVAPDTPAQEGPPLFTRWAAFEQVQADDVRRRLATAYVDLTLGHRVFVTPPGGLPARLARALLLDDDELLLSSGRRLWTRKFHYRPGLSGRFCYEHSSYCLDRLAEVNFAVDGAPVIIYANQYRIERFPSHTRVRYGFPGVNIVEDRFITYDDRAVDTYGVRSADGKAHEVTLEAIITLPPMPGGRSRPAFPLLGQGFLPGLPLYIYVDAPQFERLPGTTVHLRRTLHVKPGKAGATESRATLAIRFDNEERNQPRTPLAPDPLPAQVREYQRWFADNVPYFDSSDAAVKRMWLYRWWVVRFQLVEASAPDLNGPVFYEGKLGFDNVISFAVPAQLEELAYLRDPRYGISQARNSLRNHDTAGAVRDPPGSPYWHETYSHWIAAALADFQRVHPLPAAALDELLPRAAADVRAWLGEYDADHDGLPERLRPRVTGYDLDILSYWFFNGLRADPRAEPPPLERVDFASFVFANARAVAELAEIDHKPDLAREFRGHAQRIREAALAHLWDEDDGFFYPRRADTHERVPVRELHGFFPFLTGLSPDQPRYVRATEKFVDPHEFWARYPPVITSMAHYRKWTWEMDGLTRNIAPHPISMGGLTLLRVLKNYQQKTVTAGHFMELMKRYTDLMYPHVHPYDPLWRPNAHEYYSSWEPHSLNPRPKPSDISHDFHSMYAALIVQGAVGLTPRNDERIELDPLARDWDYFLLDRLRYHGHDLSIVWDRPDGKVRYAQYPEGFSLYIDGKQAFTRPTLGHLLFDPSSGRIDNLPPAP